MELKICHLYPDVLNLYGDRGNVLCMEKRLSWRGINVSSCGIPIGEKLTAADFDVFFIGGGQDFDRDVLLEDLGRGKAQEICAAIEDGKTVLAICGGYQMLGRSVQAADGTETAYIGALDLHTVSGNERLIGDYMFTLDDIPGESIVGFENHSGRTFLGAGVRPMGSILSGCGNNGEDGTEGARYKNVFGTYSHGCLLPKNPKLCDFILASALERKYGKSELEPLEDVLENNAHSYMVNRLRKK